MSNDLTSVQTDGIVVSAGSVLLDEEENAHRWGYYLCIENNTSKRIHLIGKNWNITDERGRSYTDSSIGFKGEIPELNPGEYFEYTSVAPLDVENAVFYGSCNVLSEGKKKEIKVPTFSLTARNFSPRRVIN